MDDVWTLLLTFLLYGTALGFVRLCDASAS